MRFSSQKKKENTKGSLNYLSHSSSWAWLKLNATNWLTKLLGWQGNPTFLRKSMCITFLSCFSSRLIRAGTYSSPPLHFILTRTLRCRLKWECVISLRSPSELQDSARIWTWVSLVLSNYCGLQRSNLGIVPCSGDGNVRTTANSLQSQQ